MREELSTELHLLGLVLSKDILIWINLKNDTLTDDFFFSFFEHPLVPLPMELRFTTPLTLKMKLPVRTPVNPLSLTLMVFREVSEFLFFYSSILANSLI